MLLAEVRYGTEINLGRIREIVEMIQELGRSGMDLRQRGSGIQKERIQKRTDELGQISFWDANGKLISSNLAWKKIRPGIVLKTQYISRIYWIWGLGFNWEKTWIILKQNSAQMDQMAYRPNPPIKLPLSVAGIVSVH